MSKLSNWIVRHQVVAFFTLAFAITWPGLFAVFFIFPGNQIVEFLAASFILFSPGLSAMLISGIANPKPRFPKSRSHWIAFAISWLIAAAVQAAYNVQVQHNDSLPAAIVVGIIFAIFPAWLISSAYSRNPGIRAQFITLAKPRGPAIWYLVIFLIFPGIPLLAMAIPRMLGGGAQFLLADLALMDALLFFLLEFTHGFLYTGGINEESGWRGFALPHLQARYPVIVSALIVWFFWAAWHIPYDIGNQVPVAWMLENRILWNLVVSIIMAWLYNRTNGSILAPALFHAAMNAFGNQFTITPAGNVMFIGVALFAIIYDRMWKRLPPEHLAVYHEKIVEG
jgi:uncharacterized protein